MCRSLVKLGSCPNMDKCDFAHDKNEIKYNFP